MNYSQPPPPQWALQDLYVGFWTHCVSPRSVCVPFTSICSWSWPGAHVPMQASWGTGVHRHTHRGWRRPWRGAVFGPPGPTRPEEALSGAGLRPGTRAVGRGFGWGHSGPELMRLEEALCWGLRPRTRAAGRGLGGEEEFRPRNCATGRGLGRGRSSGLGPQQAHGGPRGWGRCWPHYPPVP